MSSLSTECVLFLQNVFIDILYIDYIVLHDLGNEGGKLRVACLKICYIYTIFVYYI